MKIVLTILITLMLLSVSFLSAEIFILNTISQTISNLNPGTETINNSFAVTGLFPNKLATTENYIYVTNSGDNNVGKIDVVTGSILGTIQLESSSNPYDILIHAGYAYVTGLLSNKVYKIDLDTDTVVTELEVGIAPTGMTLHDNRLYVANSGVQYPHYFPGELSVIDLHEFTLLTTLAVPINPQSMIIDNNDLLHLVSTGDYESETGKISIIDTGTLEIIDTLHLTIFPTKSILTPQNRVYVADAFGGGLFAYDLPGFEIVHDCDALFPYAASALAVYQDWLIIADAGDFNSNSVIRFFDFSEQLFDSYHAAIGAVDIVTLPQPTNVSDDLIVTPLLIEAFPNPFSDNMQIRINSDSRVTLSDLTLEVYNLKGQVIMRSELKGGSIFWNGRDSFGKLTPSGIYLLKISDGNNLIDTKKVTLIR